MTDRTRKQELMGIVHRLISEMDVDRMRATSCRTCPHCGGDIEEGMGYPEDEDMDAEDIEPELEEYEM